MVEHHLAKVGVAGSNPVFRFILPCFEEFFLISPGWRNWQTHRTLNCGEFHRTGSIPGPRHCQYTQPIAQLDRVPDYESGGCRFDSYLVAFLLYGK